MNTGDLHIISCRISSKHRFRCMTLQEEKRIFFEPDLWAIRGEGQQRFEIHDDIVERLFLWLGQYIAHKKNQTGTIDKMRTAKVHNKCVEKELRELIADEVRKQFESPEEKE